MTKKLLLIIFCLSLTLISTNLVLAQGTVPKPPPLQSPPGGNEPQFIREEVNVEGSPYYIAPPEESEIEEITAQDEEENNPTVETSSDQINQSDAPVPATTTYWVLVFIGLAGLIGAIGWVYWRFIRKL